MLLAATVHAELVVCHPRLADASTPMTWPFAFHELPDVTHLAAIGSVHVSV